MQKLLLAVVLCFAIAYGQENSDRSTATATSTTPTTTTGQENSNPSTATATTSTTSTHNPGTVSTPSETIPSETVSSETVPVDTKPVVSERQVMVDTNGDGNLDSIGVDTTGDGEIDTYSRIVLVPDDEDLIDDSDHITDTSTKEKPSATIKGDASASHSIVPIVTTLFVVFAVLVALSLIVWYFGGGKQISQMMASASQTTEWSHLRITHRINPKRKNKSKNQ